MEKQFTANKITYEINEEDGYYMIGFSDNGDFPDNYVVVQRAINFDKQDVELGMDSYYFEYSEQSNSGYDLCKDVLLESDKVVFDLKENVIDQIESIIVLFENDNTIKDKEEFKDIFDKIFSK